MRIYIVTIIALILTACSPKDQNNKNPESVINLEAKSATASNLNFGDVAFDKAILVTVSIVNNGTEVLSGTPTISSAVAGAFSVVYVNTTACSNLQVGKSCSIKIALNAKLLTSGLKTETLSYDTLTFPVTANILPAPGTTENPVVKSVSMPSLVDFGSLSTTQSVVKTIIITNTSTVSLLETVSVSPPFVLSFNGCTASLLPGKSCSVKVSISGSAGAALYQTHSLNYGSVGSSSLRAEVLSPAQVAAASSNIILVYGGQELVSGSNISLGTLLQGSSSNYIMSLKNIGTGAATVSSVGLSSTQMTFTLNSCSNVTLNPGQSCSIRTNLKPSGTSPEVMSVNLLHGDVRTYNFNYVYQEIRKLTVSASSRVSISSDPAGISCSSGTCSADFHKDSSIVLTATPATGFQVSSWTAPFGCSLVGNDMTCLLSSDTTLSLPALSCASGYVSSGNNCIAAPPSGPLALTNLSQGATITQNQLVLDSDGRKKFHLNGTCSENGQEIRVVLDEFLGQQIDGMDMASMFCDNYQDYNCSAPAELFATCENNVFSVKIPLQHLTDFYWWWPYGGETNLKAYYVNNESLGPIDITFNNHASRSLYYRQDESRDWFWSLSAQPSPFIQSYPTEPGPFSGVYVYTQSNISLVLWGAGVRLTNPRNIKFQTGYYDYFDDNYDVNNYPVVGEGKISVGNETCSGGTWIQSATGYYSTEIQTQVELPSDGSVLPVSYQFRDTVTGDFSECFVRYFQKLTGVTSPTLSSVTVYNEQDQVINPGDTITSNTNSPAPIIKFQITGSWETDYPSNIITRLNVYNSQTECLNNGSSLPNAGEVQNSPGPYSSEFTTSIEYFPNPVYGQLWVNLETYINGNFHERTSCVNTGVNTIRGFDYGINQASRDFYLLPLNETRVVGYHMANQTLTTYQQYPYGVSSFGSTTNLGSTVATPAFSPMSGIWNSDMWGTGSNFAYRVSQGGTLHIVHIPDNFVQYSYEQTVSIPELSGCGSYFWIKSAWRANNKLAMICNPGNFIAVIDYDPNTNQVLNSKVFNMPQPAPMYFKDIQLVGPDKIIAVANNQVHTGAIATQSVIYEIIDAGSGFTYEEHFISDHLGIEWGQYESNNITDGVILTHSTPSSSTNSGTISVYQKNGGTYSLLQSFAGSSTMIVSPDGLKMVYYKDVGGSLNLATRTRPNLSSNFGTENLRNVGSAAGVTPKRLVTLSNSKYWYLYSNSIIGVWSY